MSESVEEARARHRDIFARSVAELGSDVAPLAEVSDADRPRAVAFGVVRAVLESAVILSAVAGAERCVLAIDSFTAKVDDPEQVLASAGTLEDRFLAGDVTVSESLLVVSIDRDGAQEMAQYPYRRDHRRVEWNEGDEVLADGVGGWIAEALGRYAFAASTTGGWAEVVTIAAANTGALVVLADDLLTWPKQ